jgi:hypothetical protein
MKKLRKERASLNCKIWSECIPVLPQAVKDSIFNHCISVASLHARGNQRIINSRNILNFDMAVKPSDNLERILAMLEVERISTIITAEHFTDLLCRHSKVMFEVHHNR